MLSRSQNVFELSELLLKDLNFYHWDFKNSEQ